MQRGWGEGDKGAPWGSCLHSPQPWPPSHRLEMPKDELPNHNCIRHLRSVVQQQQGRIAELEKASAEHKHQLAEQVSTAFPCSRISLQGPQAGLLALVGGNVGKSSELLQVPRGVGGG